MSVLSKYFSKKVDQCSPVQNDLARKVNYDEDGQEFISYESVDYPKFQASLGTVDDWSLNALLKAGINPAFPISTGLNTRLEGIDVLEDYKALAESLLVDENVESNK